MQKRQRERAEGKGAGGALVYLTRATAAAHLRSPPTRVAVMLHTTACGGCKALEPHWAQLAEAGPSSPGTLSRLGLCSAYS